MEDGAAAGAEGGQGGGRGQGTGTFLCSHLHPTISLHPTMPTGPQPTPSTSTHSHTHSATQTKSVRDLARLSLTDPEYLAVHAEAATPTPLKLQQVRGAAGVHGG